MRPESGVTAPVKILTKVLLPAPLAPISAWTSPGRTATDAWSSATTAPYVLETSVASSGGSVGAAVVWVSSVGREEWAVGGPRRAAPGNHLPVAYAPLRDVGTPFG